MNTENTTTKTTIDKFGFDHSAKGVKEALGITRELAEKHAEMHDGIVKTLKQEAKDTLDESAINKSSTCDVTLIRIFLRLFDAPESRETIQACYTLMKYAEHKLLNDPMLMLKALSSAKSAQED